MPGQLVYWCTGTGIEYLYCISHLLLFTSFSFSSDGWRLNEESNPLHIHSVSFALQYGPTGQI